MGMTANRKEELKVAVEKLMSAKLEEILEVIAILKSTPKNQVEYAETDEEPIEIKITKLLKQLGIPCNLSGHEYLKTAIALVVEDASYMKGLTKRLYPDIAEKFSVTPTKVERCIRHAIGVAFERRTLSQHKLYSYMCACDQRPTNSEFIAVIVQQIEINDND